ncbi:MULTISPECIES: DedA family protein [Cellulomonas]|uniref:DedA family protein n=1 Tax=Cellulomonas TaxID=1707 RepID=UPI0010A85115|nr:MULTISPECIES: VTT domain-containing protein [Cellulomonas]
MTEVVRAYGLDGLPLGAVLLVLLVVVLARSHATYWAGRAVARGARYEGEHRHGPVPWQRTVDRLARFATTPLARTGLALVHRWGPVAVTFAYLTVGVQSAVFAAAGLLRMPYLRFTVASLPGSVAWALVWGTVGLSAVWGAVALAAGSPWGLAVLVAVGAALAVVVARARRRRRTAAAAEAEAAAVR